VAGWSPRSDAELEHASADVPFLADGVQGRPSGHLTSSL
jgi:hypothetical protein